MPSPAAPYLCSQLASVTKGLCKPLLPANRFLPTSEETAADAATYLSARHAPKHVCLFFPFSLFSHFVLPPLVLEALPSPGRRGWKGAGVCECKSRRVNKGKDKSRKARVAARSRCQSACRAAPPENLCSRHQIMPKNPPPKK